MKAMAVAYVPVIHAGYRQFFAECLGRGASALFLLGSPFTDGFSALSRDLRALSVEEIREMVKTLSLFPAVEVLSAGYLAALKRADRVFLPDEDVSRHFVENHMPPGRAELLSIFLRWDMRALSEKRIPEHHRTIAVSAFDREIMGRAQNEAQKSPDWWRQIGAVAVKNGTVLCTAWNEHFPHAQTTYVLGDPRSNFNAGDQNDFYCSLHAEQGILARAAREEGIGLHGAAFYATTFPCARCARMLVAAGITRVYYAEGYATFDADRIFVSADIEIVHVLLT